MDLDTNILLGFAVLVVVGAALLAYPYLGPIGNGNNGVTGYSFTVDNVGTRRTTAFPAGAGIPANCWMTRAGGC